MFCVIDVLSESITYFQGGWMVSERQWKSVCSNARMHPHYILTGHSFGAVHATSYQPPNFWYSPTGTVKLNLQVPYSLAYIIQIYLTKIHNMIIYHYQINHGFYVTCSWSISSLTSISQLVFSSPFSAGQRAEVRKDQKSWKKKQFVSSHRSHSFIKNDSKMIAGNLDQLLGQYEKALISPRRRSICFSCCLLHLGICDGSVMADSDV